MTPQAAIEANASTQAPPLGASRKCGRRLFFPHIWSVNIKMNPPGGIVVNVRASETLQHALERTSLRAYIFGSIITGACIILASDDLSSTSDNWLPIAVAFLA
jgi:hypothetical protein